VDQLYNASWSFEKIIKNQTLAPLAGTCFLGTLCHSHTILVLRVTFHHRYCHPHPTQPSPVFIIMTTSSDKPMSFEEQNVELREKILASGNKEERQGCDSKKIMASGNKEERQGCDSISTATRHGHKLLFTTYNSVDDPLL
jgi:hypothetical protein